MSIDAKTVKSLRERTGAGMMDCKKALMETNGDLEKAIEILRIKGVSKASKKMSREANEGLVFICGEIVTPRALIPAVPVLNLTFDP